MKIQKVPTDNMDAAVFSVNETEYSVKEGWASISIPSKTFGGKGKVQLLLKMIKVYVTELLYICLIKSSTFLSSV